MSNFKFTDTKNKNVLKGEGDSTGNTARKMGRPPAEVKRSNKIACYFSDEEFQEVQDFLDGRPASSYLRQVILDRVREEK